MNLYFASISAAIFFLLCCIKIHKAIYFYLLPDSTAFNEERIPKQIIRQKDVAYIRLNKAGMFGTISHHHLLPAIIKSISVLVIVIDGLTR